MVFKKGREKRATRMIEVGLGGDHLSVATFALKVLSGPRRGTSIVSEGEEITIGSARECTLALEGDDTISRNHCTLSVEDGGFRLTDLDSTNGTWIGGARLDSALIVADTEILVGRTRLKLIPRKKHADIPIAKEPEFGELLGAAPKMLEVFAKLEKVAPTEVNALIQGESGTGKELAARAIHDHSLRAGGPYEVFDCTAVAPSVIESELFGHEKGAFTGAATSYKGVFERATGGTLFIDEIGDLRSDLQPKLLRAIETKEIRRVGGSDMIRADVRVVAATNRDLRLDVNKGTFRLDLYYRLAGVRLTMPPLRERVEDIPLLSKLFADKFAKRHGMDQAPGDLTSETTEALRRHRWPGNVRELRNFVEQSLVLAEMAELPGRTEGPSDPTSGHEGFRTDIPYKEAREELLDRFCKEYFSTLLERNKYNVTNTAKEAGIDRVYAQRMIKRYDLK